MLIAGGLYLSWIGYSLIRSRAITKLDTQVKLRSVSDTFRNGMVTSLLNPKAYLFTLAILPQFLRPEYGSMWIQATVLFSIIAVTQFVVYGVVALGADRVREWTVTSPRGGAIAARMVGVLLIAIALTTVLRGWNAV
ncbi:MAG: LysE family translocator, partial [Opitutus sp.]